MNHIITLIIIIAALLISLPGAFTSGPIWPDGQRYTFNGILLHDMIRDGAIFQPFNYTVNFYARYPSTNFPYGPPFFAIVFAIAFSIFGISFGVARCVVAVYAVCAALMCRHLVYRLTKSYLLSLISVSVFLFNSLTGIYSRDITPELPVAFFSFLLISFFYEYIEDDKKYFGIFASLAFSLGYLTKPYIIPLGFALFLYMAVRRKWHIFCKRETLFAICITAVLILPPTILAFKYAVNELGPRTRSPLDWNSVLAYPKMAIKLLPALTLFSVFGFIVGLIKKDRLVLLCLIWVACLYFFFTFYVPGALGAACCRRYFFSFVPAMVLPSALAFHTIILYLRRFRLDKIALMLFIASFIYIAYSSPIYYIRGYEDVGKYIAENPRGKTVLFYGYRDGTFMMGLRRRIPKDGPYVLRAERQFAIRVPYGDAGQSVLIKSPDDIIKILNEYRTGYVVVEREMPKSEEFPEHKILMKALQNTKLFKEAAIFPIRSNFEHRGPIVVYAYNFDERSKKADFLKIPIPTSKMILEIKF